jgi:acetolactate synthase-1/2/3 large subunit
MPDHRSPDIVTALADGRVNGAQSLLVSLRASGIDTCFANPGTSEMHFVAALDRVEGLRCILGLFEGAVTGAADGYARMLDRPAATLLHLRPGLANGLSNLHNARRAQSAVVNVIGDHATYHRALDAPLTSDIEGAARPFSHWVRTSPNADSLAADAAAAVAAALSAPGRIASLILPADAAWSPVTAGRPLAAPPATPQGPTPVAAATVEAAARLLRAGRRAALILGGRTLRAAPLELAGRIAAVTGARLFCPTMTARLERGAGRVPVERLPYVVEQAVETLREIDTLLLVGAKPPVGFFAYPDKPSQLWQPGTLIFELAPPEGDGPRALRDLAEALGALKAEPRRAGLEPPARPTGAMSLEGLGAIIAATLPEHAIVVDESITSGRNLLSASAGAPPHDWLLGTGGSIGWALPVAAGAAVACPERKVLALESDGSGLMMPQTLWTYARERLNILTVIFANRSYQILHQEMQNVGASNIGPKARRLLDLDNPVVDWVSLARGFGLPASRVETLDELGRALDAGYALQGPCLIEVLC